MRTPTDALRSVNRYVAQALGDEWEVRLSTQRGTFARPYARITQVPSVQMINQGWSLSKMLMSVSVVAYPPAGVDADAAHLAALAVADAFWYAFAGPGAGTPNIRKPADSRRGRPQRIPLYDYAGVPLDGPTAFVAETARDVRDFMHVEGSPEVQVFNDPDDETLYSVAANIRMSWLRSAAVTSAAPTATRIPIEVQPNG